MDTEIQFGSLSIQTPPHQTTPEALSLPEVLSCIFSFFKGNRKILRSAACVNQIWFEEATRLLWDTSDTQALSAVEASRRTVYAPKIREFTLRSVFSHPNLDLDFRLLRILHFTDIPGSQDVNPSQFLRPALEEIYFRGWPPTGLLQQLNIRCPNLRVMVQTKPSFMEKQKFIEFLASNQSLQRVQLTLIPLDKDRMLAAFLALGSLPKLEDLTVLGETYNGTLARLQRLRLSYAEASSKPCFETVRKVKLTTEVPALSLLNSTFGAMTNISLVVHMRTEGQSLEALASLPLESLELSLGIGVKLWSHELLFLRNAKNLKRLIIKPEPFNPRGRMSTFKTSSTDFEQIFEELSALDTLLIWFTLDMPNSRTALEQLGRSCPKLENMRLYMPIDLMAWLHVPNPLFPNLKFAWVSTVSDSNGFGNNNDSNAELMAQILNRHAPKLDRFVALDSYDFRPTNADPLSSLVMRWHGRIKETGQTRHAREANRGTVNR